MARTLLCLHGWGGSKESFDALRHALEGSGLRVLTPDLPGFGSEPEPKEPWSVDDYAAWVEQWVDTQLPGTEQPHPIVSVLGHSHGGRIAIKLAATRKHLNIDHLFLCAAAGIRRPRHIKRLFGLFLAKSGKFLLSIPGLKILQPLGKKLLYKLVRVHDYERASPVMQQTLVNVTREDLRPLLANIKTPTDIFWGKDDRMTPYADAVVMHDEIPNSMLYSYPGVRHSVHKDRAAEIAAVITKDILKK
jgi:pimeloyl-ACP methyl ester carboxylesterase